MTKKELLERFGEKIKRQGEEHGETKPKLFFNPSKGEFEIAPENLEIPSIEEQLKGMVVE